MGVVQFLFLSGFILVYVVVLGVLTGRVVELMRRRRSAISSPERAGEIQSNLNTLSHRERDDWKTAE
jgi:hypothetical protein